MTARAEVTPLLDIVLQSAAHVFSRKFEFIPLEFEQVVLKALIEAYEKGEVEAHTKPTIPSKTNAQGIPTGVPDSLAFADDSPWPASEKTPVRWPHPLKRK